MIEIKKKIEHEHVGGRRRSAAVGVCRPWARARRVRVPRVRVRACVRVSRGYHAGRRLRRCLLPRCSTRCQLRRRRRRGEEVRRYWPTDVFLFYIFPVTIFLHQGGAARSSAVGRWLRWSRGTRVCPSVVGEVRTRVTVVGNGNH